MLRLSVAITVTLSKVVAHATAVVNPRSWIRVSLQSYGPVGVPLKSNNRRGFIHIEPVVHRRRAGLLTQPLTTVTFASVTLRTRTVRRWTKEK